MKHGKARMHGSSESEGKAWGHGQHANMPQEVKMQSYAKNKMLKEPMENDTMTRIDMEISRSDGKARSHSSDQH